MLRDYTAYDERRNQNEYATYEEIDERQVQGLLVLLERWEQDGMKPWDVLVQASRITGARSSFLIGYETSLDFIPGTRNFDGELRDVRRKIPEMLAEIGTWSLQSVQALKERIQRIRKHGGDKNPETQTHVITQSRNNIEEAHEESWLTLPEVTQEEGFEGPEGYLQAIKDIVSVKQEGIKAGEEWTVALAESFLLSVHRNKMESEDDAAHVDAALQRATAEAWAKHQRCIDGLTAEMRPQTLASEPIVFENARVIRQKLLDGEFDSWQGALAIAEVIFKSRQEIQAEIDAENRRPDAWKRGKRTSLLSQFGEDLNKEKAVCEIRKTNLDKTVDLFRPESEAEIKQTIAKAFASAAAYDSWEKERGKRFQFFTDPDEVVYEKQGRPGAPTEDDVLEFKSPIELPDRKICNGIHIQPVGTGLIRVFEQDEFEDNFHDSMYGTTVARITTYQISFVPADPKDMNLLATAVQEALKAFDKIPHKYGAPAGFFSYSESGGGYIRPGGDFFWGVDRSGEKITPQVRLDLDDLWVLYYLLEPIIEPNAQIAAAMNSARYAEERGAILEPDAFDYLDKGHTVGNKFRCMSLVNPKDLLRVSVRDAFIDYGMNVIDEAEFILRMTTIASHTLTGRMQDPGNVFKSHPLLNGERSAEPLLPNQALQTRVGQLVKLGIGESNIDGLTMMDALHKFKQTVTNPLRAQAREKNRNEDIVFRREMDRHFMQTMAAAQNLDLADIIRKTFPEEPEPEKKKDDETAQEDQGPGGELTRVVNLVVAESKVETAIDGLHGNGRYRTRTKGSILVRKELPDALKLFVQDQSINPIKRLSEPVME